MRVYLAGPLVSGGGDPWLNISLAAKTFNRLRRAGFTVEIPHLLTEVEKIDPGTSWEEWLQYCLRAIRDCQVLLRMPGKSAGADREVDFARQIGIPVFFDEHELMKLARPSATHNAKACSHGRTYDAGLWPKCALCGAWIEVSKCSLP